MSSNHSADIAGAGTPAGVVATSAGRGQFPRAGGEFGAGGFLPPVGSAAGGAPASDPRHSSLNSPPAASCAPGVLFEGTSHYGRWTEAEAHHLRQVWPDSTVLNSELEPMFRRTLCAIRAKAQLMRLGKRPAVCDGKRRAAAQRRLLQQMRQAHRHRIAALQDEIEAPVEPAAPGLRETERLVRARLLVQRGIGVESVIAGLRLTAIEVVALRASA